MSGKTLQKVVIGLGGSFNPIHPGHVETLLVARQALEQDDEHEVVGILLAVATDSWVLGKLGPHKAMKAKHRLAMTNLAIQSLRELNPEVGALFLPQSACFLTASRCAQAMYSGTPLEGCEVVNVVGTDRAMQSGRPAWRQPGKRKTVLVFRESGERLGAEKMMKQWQKDLQSGLVHDPNLWILSQHTSSAAHHSSTAVRELLLKAWRLPAEEMEAQLIESQLVDPLVAQYMVSHRADLFMKDP